MAITTRDKLIDVARRLFARKGLENTTMNDIAEASDKGRRTVYTYFKNKAEIYNAVIEHESERMLAKLKEVSQLAIPPVEKLEKYLRVRFDILSQLSTAKDGFWTIFTPDGRKIAKARKRAQEKERELFYGVIDEGIRSGSFNSEQASRLPKIESYLFHVIGMANTRTDIDASEKNVNEVRESIIEFIINGICPNVGSPSPSF